MKNRSPLQITLSVWKALFMREILSRIMSNRYAWFWLFAEPVLFILIMMSIRLIVRSGDTIAGSDRVTWLILGLTAFLMLRDTAIRAMGAIESNKGLMAYRQIKSFDTVLVRLFVELFLRTIVLLVLLLIFGLIGQDVIPKDAITATIMWLSIWGLGVGFGIMFAVINELVSGFNKVVSMMSMPLLLLSGVVLPLHSLPPEILYYLMFNPIAHGLELFRYYFLDNYWMVSGVSLLYFYLWILGTIFVGLVLYFRFESRLKAQ